MNKIQQVSLLAHKEVSLPLGTTKNSREVTADTEFGIIQGGGAGIVTGGLISWVIAFNAGGGDPTSMLLTISSIAPMLTMPLIAIGASTGYALSRYFETKSKLKSVAPGFTFKKGLHLTKAFPSFKEKRDIVYLESQFGRIAKEVVIVRKHRDLHLEYLVQQPAGDVWDDSMKSLKNVYGIQPKSAQKTEITRSVTEILRENDDVIHITLPTINSLLEKAKKSMSPKRKPLRCKAKEINLPFKLDTKGK